MHRASDDPCSRRSELQRALKDAEMLVEECCEEFDVMVARLLTKGRRITSAGSYRLAFQDVSRLIARCLERLW